MPVPTIEWVGSMNKGRIKIVDQTLLPEQFKFINCKDIESIWEAIKVLRVRGAPALGVAAAYAVILGVRNVKTTKWSEFKKELNKVVKKSVVLLYNLSNIYHFTRPAKRTALMTRRGLPIVNAYWLFQVEERVFLDQDPAIAVEV